MTRESSHDTVHELLPWYANQTLDTEECALVEQHLARCPSCTQELQHLYDIGAVMKEAGQTAPSLTPSLDRTLAAIDDWDKARQQGAWRWFKALWTPSVPVARLVFAGQLGIILIFAGLLLIPRLTEKPYKTTGEDGAISGGGARLTITFQPDTTEQAMRQALLENHASIVEGPRATGVYVIELTGLKEDDPAVETEITKLRNMSSLVRFVERAP